VSASRILTRAKQKGAVSFIHPLFAFKLAGDVYRYISSLIIRIYPEITMLDNYNLKDLELFVSPIILLATNRQLKNIKSSF
jgi:hypothetical protein